MNRCNIYVIGDSSRTVAMAHVQAFAELVRDAVRTIQVKRRRQSDSIGILVRLPKSALDVCVVTTFADLALYEAKSTSRDSVVFYSEAVGAEFSGKSSNLAIVRPTLRVVR